MNISVNEFNVDIQINPVVNHVSVIDDACASYLEGASPRPVDPNDRRTSVCSSPRLK